MERWGRQVRIAIAAIVLVWGVSPAASAAPLLIGTFSWVTAADETQTFEVTSFGADPWPLALTLDNLFVDYIRDGGATGQAFFDGDVNCVGLEVSLGAGGLYQSPGDFSAGCPLGPLPQDIVSATLNFSYNALLGIVTVGTLGPAFAEGAPTGDLQQILFEPAESPVPVPEPTSLVLLGSGLAGAVLRRKRQR
jgi:hypothetical protein